MSGQRGPAVRYDGGMDATKPATHGGHAPRETGETGLVPKAEHSVSHSKDTLAPWHVAEAANTSGARQVTQTVRAGIECDDPTGCVVPPLHLTSTFAFRGFGEKGAYDYSRSGNPTRDLLAVGARRARAPRG